MGHLRFLILYGCSRLSYFVLSICAIGSIASSQNPIWGNTIFVFILADIISASALYSCAACLYCCVCCVRVLCVPLDDDDDFVPLDVWDGDTGLPPETEDQKETELPEINIGIKEDQEMEEEGEEVVAVTVEDVEDASHSTELVLAGSIPPPPDDIMETATLQPTLFFEVGPSCELGNLGFLIWCLVTVLRSLAWLVVYSIYGLHKKCCTPYPCSFAACISIPSTMRNRASSSLASLCHATTISSYTRSPSPSTAGPRNKPATGLNPAKGSVTACNQRPRPPTHMCKLHIADCGKEDPRNTWSLTMVCGYYMLNRFSLCNRQCNQAKYGFFFFKPTAF